MGLDYLLMYVALQLQFQLENSFNGHRFETIAFADIP